MDNVRCNHQRDKGRNGTVCCILPPKHHEEFHLAVLGDTVVIWDDEGRLASERLPLPLAAFRAVPEPGRLPESVPDILKRLGTLYEARNTSYGNSWKHFGRIMLGLFPDGLRIDVSEDGLMDPHEMDEALVAKYNRLGILVMMLAKISRQPQSLFTESPHIDSNEDLAVYAAMMTELIKNG